jgi:excinuclease ABC subunit A
VVIEHNPEVIKCADWIVDLGPVGGKNGGYLVFQGTPEDLVNCAESATAPYIAL